MKAEQRPDLTITVKNHMERDKRLDAWSVYGIGSYTHPTEEWVRIFLDVSIDVELPEYLQQMFDRAQACIVYGCYHYPLFTLGIEELFRFGESAFREAIKETKPSKSTLKKTYAEIQNWACEQGLLDNVSAKRWSASRDLRNSFSHKDGPHLQGPNDAWSQLAVTKELTEALFQSCREYAKRNHASQS